MDEWANEMVYIFITLYWVLFYTGVSLILRFLLKKIVKNINSHLANLVSAFGARSVIFSIYTLPLIIFNFLESANYSKLSESISLIILPRDSKTLLSIFATIALLEAIDKIKETQSVRLRNFSILLVAAWIIISLIFVCWILTLGSLSTGAF